MLPFYKLEKTIRFFKSAFEMELCQGLGLVPVPSPLVIHAGTGINDALNGTEPPVRLQVGSLEAEVVQSLAKWKRVMLGRYGFPPGEGLVANMRALRPAEDLGPIRSVYVDQWDWEKVITPEERNLDTLCAAARVIYIAVRAVHLQAAVWFDYEDTLPDQVTFLTAAELCARYPDRSPREREQIVCREHGAVFLMGIGGALQDGQPHDGRAPDYDDWSLNGDLLVWNPVLNQSFELSSMGIRVNSEVLAEQMKIRGVPSQAFHKQVLQGELPQTMGGGIGQSRLAMLLLQATHIGQVAFGLWPDVDSKRWGLL